MNTELKQYIDDRTVTDVTTDCWDWQRSTSRGYGDAGTNSRWVKRYNERKAHRLAYIAYKGAIPEDAVVMHTCDNRLCCNPAHLTLGSQSDNMADRHQKGRNAVGTDYNRKGLTEDDIRAIRRIGDSMSRKGLGERYGVTGRTITDIITRKTWKHVV